MALVILRTVFVMVAAGIGGAGSKCDADNSPSHVSADEIVAIDTMDAVQDLMTDAVRPRVSARQFETGPTMLIKLIQLAGRREFDPGNTSTFVFGAPIPEVSSLCGHPAKRLKTAVAIADLGHCMGAYAWDPEE